MLRQLFCQFSYNERTVSVGFWLCGSTSHTHYCAHITTCSNVPAKSEVKEKKLFTPGPLCVSSTVKAALTRDLGSRDKEFIQIVKNLRVALVEIADLSPTEYTAVIVQGSGTFAVESVLQSTSNREKGYFIRNHISPFVQIVANGAYGQRMKTICDKTRIPSDLCLFKETQQVVIEEVMEMLNKSPGKYSSVAVVHCETTSGIVNQVEELGEQIKEKYPEITYIVDGMSSFAGIEADYSSVDFLISSANKCLQGIPGFAFVICRTAKLEQCKGLSTSVVLDLYDQWRGLEDNGQFRFTPPTHAILGLKQACLELEEEGGVTGRAARYAKNCEIIQRGMAQRGFQQLVDKERGAGHIITSFHYPHSDFNFNEFYNRLSEMDQIIYPGKVTNADCFRIGHIGHLDQVDMQNLLNCIDKVMLDMTK